MIREVLGITEQLRTTMSGLCELGAGFTLVDFTEGKLNSKVQALMQGAQNIIDTALPNSEWIDNRMAKKAVAIGTGLASLHHTSTCETHTRARQAASHSHSQGMHVCNGWML